MATRRFDRLAVLGAAFLFSTGGVVIKATSWSGFAVAGGRAAVAALVLLWLMPRWRRFWQPKALAVGAAYAATMVLFVVANKLTTAANAIFLQATAPLYLLVLGPWLLGERNRHRDVLLTAVLAVGMGLFFVGSEQPGETATDPALGNLVAAAAGFTWAWTLVGLRWIGRQEPGSEVFLGSSDLAGAAVVAGNVLAFLLCLPFAFPLPAATPTDLALVGYLGVFQIGLAYVLMTRGIERVPALEVALLLLLEPVLSAGLAWSILGERPGSWALAGCLVILAGTAGRTLLAMRGSTARAN
jgi:drug/metabolite transporter (DMT)-like permease